MENLTGFVKQEPFQINENIFSLLDNTWMLITAGTPDKFNTMTASWGGFGILWNKAIATIYIRPQRFTHEFVENNKGFNLSFFKEEYRKALNFCGSKSGREFDKIKETGLTPVLTPNGLVTFKESYLSMDCIKLYADNLNPKNFIDESIPGKVYPTNDFHTFYIGEIIDCFTKKQ